MDPWPFDPSLPRSDRLRLLTEELRYLGPQFFELRDGQCRLLPPLTFELIHSAPMWGRATLPIAQALAARLLEFETSLSRPTGQKRSDGLRGPSIPGGRGPSTRPRRGNRVVMREHRPLTRIASGDLADPRFSEEANVKRRAAMANVVQANRRWDRKSDRTDRDGFRREIFPRIQGMPLKTLMKATGLTKGACSLIRAGAVTPHPRHWKALGRLL